jgi:hypothetical protein
LNPTQNGLFQPISVTQGSVKIGAYGPQGSGKTTTLFLLAIGLSLTYHKGAPIMYHDTENGSDFMKRIADVEGVEVFVAKSRSFQDMCRGLHEGEKNGACVYLEDSITHDWNELMEAFKAKKGITKIQIDHWGEIKPQWANDWVVPMLNSPLHILIAGRAGMIYESVEQEDGTSKNEVTGSKMKAEGDFGYEPNLLIEMFGERVRMAPDGTPIKGKKRAAKRGGTYVHHAYVLKDRTRNLQGKEFTWQNLNDYKKGDWKKVFDAFQPHFNFFNIGGAQKALTSSPSTGLFNSDGNSEYFQKKRRKDVALEEIESTLTLLWPGKDAKSTRIKLLVIEKIFNTRSWTKVTQMIPDAIESGLSYLQQFELKSKNMPREDETVVLQALAELKGEPVEQTVPSEPVTVTQ